MSSRRAEKDARRAARTIHLSAIGPPTAVPDRFQKAFATMGIPPSRSPTAASHIEAPSRLISRPVIVGQSRMPEGIMAEHWQSIEYSGHVRRYATGCPIGDGPYAVISIVAAGEVARHDWREFQQLKNYLVGDEWEGLELYPAESRLQDPSNCYYLWCMPRGVIPWGSAMGDRNVLDAHEALAPQRPFPS